MRTKRSILGRAADAGAKGVLRPPTAEEEAELNARATAREVAKAERSEAWDAAKQDRHDKRVAFLLSEAEKYEAKAQELEAKGKTNAAARARRVSESNRAKANKITAA